MPARRGEQHLLRRTRVTYGNDLDPRRLQWRHQRIIRSAWRGIRKQCQITDHADIAVIDVDDIELPLGTRIAPARFV